MYRYYLNTHNITEDFSDGHTELYNHIKDIRDELIEATMDMLKQKWCEPILGVTEIASEIQFYDYISSRTIITNQAFVRVKQVIRKQDKYFGLSVIPGNIIVELPNGKETEMFGKYGLNSTITSELLRNKIANAPSYYYGLTTHAIHMYYNDLEMQDEMRRVNMARVNYEDNQRQVAIAKIDAEKKTREDAIRKQMEFERKNAEARKNVNDLFRQGRV